MFERIRGTFTILGLVLLACDAIAGRPMLVDDAGILDRNDCQLETWLQRYQGSDEYWVVPACNFLGGVEIAIGGARVVEDSARTSAILFQAKTVLRPLETNGWGFGLVGGNERRTQIDASSTDNLFASAIYSLSLRDDQTFLHANLGARRDSSDGRSALTWGVALETQLTERAWVVAEVLGEHRGKPLFQIGARYWIIPERVQVDASYGNRFGGDAGERWTSIGLALFWSVGSR